METKEEQEHMQDQSAPVAAPATQVATQGKAKRPIVYDEKLATKICAYIADQKPLRWIAKQKGMPALRTIMYWLEKNPDFERQYNRARAAMVESFVSEMIELADQAQGMSGEGVQAMRLRLDTRKWVAVKLLPKKYGERVQHGIDEDVVLNLTVGRRPEIIDVTPEVAHAD